MCVRILIPEHAAENLFFKIQRFTQISILAQRAIQRKTMKYIYKNVIYCTLRISVMYLSSRYSRSRNNIATTMSRSAADMQVSEFLIV